MKTLTPQTRHLAYFIVAAALAFLFVGCGGTYIDDKRNFERAFGSKCPPDIEVIHSIYTSTPHFTDEHECYFEIKPAAGSGVLKWLTGNAGAVQSTNGLSHVPFHLNLRPDRPQWFPKEPLTDYDIWYYTNATFIVLRNKQNAEIFVYASVGM